MSNSTFAEAVRSRCRRTVRRLVPGSVLETAAGRRALARIFGIAVMIRLVLMPIALHGDLLSTYYRSYRFLETFHPKALVPHELLQSLFLVLYSPILPLDELFAWQGKTMVPFDFWMGTFVVHPAVAPAIFLFKLPYFLCDIGVAFVLLRLFEDAPGKALRAVSLWLLNPVNIFVFYVFARHDVVAILFLALGLLALRRDEPLRGALAIGVAIWSRYYALFFLPFLVVTLGSRRRQALSIVASALAPLVAYNLVIAVVRRSAESQSLRMAESKFFDYLLDFELSLGWSQEVFVFPALLGALFLYSTVAPRPGDRVLGFSRYCVCCMALFYASVYFHPQYFTWFVLFLVVVRADGGDPVLRNVYRLQMLLYIPYTFYFGSPVFGLLFAPLGRDFFMALPAPWDWIAAHGPPERVLGLARSALSASCVFMVGWLLFGARRQAAPTPPRAGAGRADQPV